MKFVFLVLLTVYTIRYFLYYGRIYTVIRGHWLYYGIVITLNISSYMVMDYINLPQTGVLVMIVSFMIGLKLLFKIDLIQMMCSAVIYVLTLYCFKGIVVSVFALILDESVNDIIQGEYFYTINSIAVLVAIIFGRFVANTFANEFHVRQFYRNNSQLKYMVFFQLALLFYLMTIFDGRLIDSKPIWFTLIYFKSNIWSMVLMLVVWYKSLRLTYLQEFKQQSKQLQGQLERQLRHYKSYQKYTESFRNFKHDYKNMMFLVKTLLKKDEKDKASKLIDDIQHTMRKSVLVHKHYSNNFILDAILQDGANACDDCNIRFSAQVHIPPQTALSELDIIRIFSNVLNNAIEACYRIVDYTDRFIDVSSSTNEGWTCIVITNSFNGEIMLEGEGLVTTKRNKENHGNGIKILKEIIENVGGVMLIEIDQIEKKFITKILIP
ncbi:sensory histidine kinase DcuS [compost metagenome]